MLMSFIHFSSGHIQVIILADDSKVEFCWCYNKLFSIFIMKNIVTVDTTNEAYSLIYRYEKTRRVIPTNLAPKRNNKNMFKFLLCFPENNLNTLLCNTLELLVDFDRLLPIVINFVPIPTKQKIEVNTSVCMVF